jgi:hypothetical protein
MDYGCCQTTTRTLYCTKDQPVYSLIVLAWYAEFLLEIDLKILLRKTGARLIFKIALISLHIDPEDPWTQQTSLNS